MPSQVTICNLALSEIGKASITAIDENSEPSRKCKTFWDQVRKFVLADYDWSFAKKTIALTVSAVDSNPNWAFCYTYPSDCIMPRKVYAAGRRDAALAGNFEVIQVGAGNALLIVTDQGGAYLDYTANVVLPEMFDESFVEAIKYQLAAQIAFPLTGKSSLKNDMLQLYALALDGAKRNNRLKQYEKPDNTQNSPFLDCRG
jgi:hypothetical protein